jgi:hypothetical protein
MLRVGFEPRIPVFEWTKTVHALDSAATVIGGINNRHLKFCTSIGWSLVLEYFMKIYLLVQKLHCFLRHTHKHDAAIGLPLAVK